MGRCALCSREISPSHGDRNGGGNALDRACWNWVRLNLQPYSTHNDCQTMPGEGGFLGVLLVLLYRLADPVTTRRKKWHLVNVFEV